MKPKPILSVTDLRVSRGRKDLLRGVEWTVKRGEHWVILGPNGCGKTSLLRALTGYLPPSAGEIALLGENYGESDWRELRRQIGLVSSALQISIPPAEPALETVMSGKFAQLDLWARTTAADRSFGRRLLRRVGTPELEAREWVFLSQGERQRVLIARALMAKPKLLILDEPCGGLDPLAREHFLAMIDELGRQKSSPSLVLVTHHVEEIVPTFTHALLMRAGGIVAAGPLRSTLTTASLRATFKAGLTLTLRDRRYRLRLSEPHARSASTF